MCEPAGGASSPNFPLLPVETLFDHNNYTATIGDHIVPHAHLTWALPCEEVKAPGVQPI